MVNFDLRLVGVTAVSLLGLYAMNRPKPFTPYDDDQSKRPRRPNRRPRDPLRPRRPISAESFEADECGCGDEMVMEAESFEGETEVFCASLTPKV